MYSLTMAEFINLTPIQECMANFPDTPKTKVLKIINKMQDKIGSIKQDIKDQSILEPLKLK